MLRTMLLASAAVTLAMPAVAQNAAPAADTAAISGLGVRNIGSAKMSGRVSAVAGRREKDGKYTLFVGSASGGGLRSKDSGATFKSGFYKQPVQTVRAV